MDSARRPSCNFIPNPRPDEIALQPIQPGFSWRATIAGPDGPISVDGPSFREALEAALDAIKALTRSEH
jgi:hypothetical protein